MRGGKAFTPQFFGITDFGDRSQMTSQAVSSVGTPELKTRFLVVALPVLHLCACVAVSLKTSSRAPWGYMFYVDFPAGIASWFLGGLTSSFLFGFSSIGTLWWFEVGKWADRTHGSRDHRREFFRQRIGTGLCIGASRNGGGIIPDRAGGAWHGQHGLLQRTRKQEQRTFGSRRCESSCGKLVEGPIHNRWRRLESAQGTL